MKRSTQIKTHNKENEQIDKEKSFPERISSSNKLYIFRN